jgi:hypothetical protein
MCCAFQKFSCCVRYGWFLLLDTLQAAMLSDPCAAVLTCIAAASDVVVHAAGVWRGHAVSVGV